MHHPHTIFNKTHQHLTSHAFEFTQPIQVGLCKNAQANSQKTETFQNAQSLTHAELLNDVNNKS